MRLFIASACLVRFPKIILGASPNYDLLILGLNAIGCAAPSLASEFRLRTDLYRTEPNKPSEIFSTLTLILGVLQDLFSCTNFHGVYSRSHGIDTHTKHSFPSRSPSDAFRRVGSGCRVPESGIGLKGNMPWKIINLVGQRFGNLVVQKFSAFNKNGSATYECLCDCGKKFVASSAGLRKRVRPTTSCGCLRIERIRAKAIKHGMENTPTYQTWRSMKSRCLNPNATGYENYGGRGITICDKWMKFEGFTEDMGIRPEGTTLERKDNSLGYSKDNCKWATPKEQSSNMRKTVSITINGETKCVSEWARIKGFRKDTLRLRMLAGWPTDRLFEPVNPRKNKYQPTTQNH